MDKIVVNNYSELKNIVKDRKIPLDRVDVSKITYMKSLFQNVEEINGSISDWDTSNVNDMSYMFDNSIIQPDISKWNVSKVIVMDSMFINSFFNGDISSWDISSVVSMKNMFSNSKFNGDISKWNIENVKNMAFMFNGDKSFNKNLGIWDLKEKQDPSSVFFNCKYTKENYLEDRKNYLDDLEIKKNELIKEKEEQIIKAEIIKLNEALNQDIDLDTLEMEF